MASRGSSVTDALQWQRSQFARQGFVVVPDLVPQALRDSVAASIAHALNPLQGPAEFEADVGYPGAPASRDAPGGQTPRRLLQAYSRDESFRQLATLPSVGRTLAALLGVTGDDDDRVCLSQCHHNCVMTKYPGFSSATLWHQDIRYWSFDRRELISVWFALGEENRHNGSLRVIPGTHQLDLDLDVHRGRLDKDLFLRPELRENRELIEQSEAVQLAPGDVLFFHCRLFHAAGMNRSDTVKLSPVFTYHTASNRPIPDTRSARYPSIELPVGGSMTGEAP
ncbi:MAG: phytanoyl-CoA dioxygenase family protein [Pseudomonadaceae bacterium]|nr:phytanoyl-CoA dioxygenase family protein [Pseudomonadaceae bacterium]